MCAHSSLHAIKCLHQRCSSSEVSAEQRAPPVGEWTPRPVKFHSHGQESRAQQAGVKIPDKIPGGLVCPFVHSSRVRLENHKTWWVGGSAECRTDKRGFCLFASLQLDPTHLHGHTHAPKKTESNKNLHIQRLKAWESAVCCGERNPISAPLQASAAIVPAASVLSADFKY